MYVIALVPETTFPVLVMIQNKFSIYFTYTCRATSHFDSLVIKLQYLLCSSECLIMYVNTAEITLHLLSLDSWLEDTQQNVYISSCSMIQYVLICDFGLQHIQMRIYSD